MTGEDDPGEDVVTKVTGFQVKTLTAQSINICDNNSIFQQLKGAAWVEVGEKSLREMEDDQGGELGSTTKQDVQVNTIRHYHC